ncbi:MAG: NAD(P)H-binding protein [Muribaculaceae bacterium]
MKEIAVTGLNGHVLSEVLSYLLHKGVTVNAYVNNPERLMDTSTQLTASLLDVYDKERLRSLFTGYDTVIMTFDDDQSDHDENSFVLENYGRMVHAAREAGVKRLVIVGSPQAEAFFIGDLKRQDEVDWTFVSTEGDFAKHATDEALTPTTHKAVYYAE